MIYSTRGAYEKCACGGYVWNKFIRRRVIGNVRFTEETSAAEDEFFSFDVIQSTSAKVYYDCTPLYWYRQRDGSLVKTSKFSFKSTPKAVPEAAKNKIIKSTEIRKYFCLFLNIINLLF